MSLTKVRLLDIVKKQYVYKLKAYIGVFSSLVIIQVIGALFSLGGTGSMGMGSENISLRASYYTGDVIIAFTLLWGFISSILLTTKAYRYDDFSFVSNRLTSHLSNIVFLITASVIGGVTAMLASVVLKGIVLNIYGNHVIGTLSGFNELLLGMVAITFYLLLLTALGYFIGVLTQLSKVFIIIVPTLFLAALLLRFQTFDQPMIVKLINYYAGETSLFFFIVKVTLTAIVLLCSTVVMSGRMEVRS